MGVAELPAANRVSVRLTPLTDLQNGFGNEPRIERFCEQLTFACKTGAREVSWIAASVTSAVNVWRAGDAREYAASLLRCGCP